MISPKAHWARIIHIASEFRNQVATRHCFVASSASCQGGRVFPIHLAIKQLSLVSHNLHRHHCSVVFFPCHKWSTSVLSFHCSVRAFKWAWRSDAKGSQKLTKKRKPNHMRKRRKTGHIKKIGKTKQTRIAGKQYMWEFREETGHVRKSGNGT